MEGEWKSVPTPQNNGLRTPSSNTNRYKHRRVTIKKKYIYKRERDADISSRGYDDLIEPKWQAVSLLKKVSSAFNFVANQHECRQEKDTVISYALPGVYKCKWNRSKWSSGASRVWKGWLLPVSQLKRRSVGQLLRLRVKSTESRVSSLDFFSCAQTHPFSTSPLQSTIKSIVAGAKVKADENNKKTNPFYDNDFVRLYSIWRYLYEGLKVKS